MANLTFRQMAALIKDDVEGGSATIESSIDIRDILLKIRLGANYLQGVHFNQMRAESSYEVDDSLITTFEDVPIEYAANRDHYYAKLPASLIWLPKNRGMRKVAWMKDETNEFLILEDGAERVFSDLEAMQIANTYMCKLDGKISGKTLENGRLVFIKLPDAMKTDGKVLVKMIASASGLGDNEKIPVTDIMEMELLQMVKNDILGIKPIPTDRVNDSAPNQVR